MKKRTAYLIICALIFSVTVFGQNHEKNVSSSKDSETIVDLQRTIRLEKDSKPEEIIINIKQKTRRFEQQNIINCDFGADNQGLQPASASVFFDRKVPRTSQLIIFAERLPFIV